MTTPTDTETPAESTPVRERLRAAANKRTTTAPTKRRTTTRKTAPSGPQSRATVAAKKGRHADRIAPLIKAGAAMVGIRNPIQGMILARQADPFAAALERVAAEDPRVDALLVKVGGLLGKGGAWGELGQVTLATGGAMLLAGGTVPAGPLGIVLTFVAGSLVEQATHDAAYSIAVAELDAVHGETWPPGVAVDPARVAQIAAGLRPRPPAAPAADDDGDQGAAPPAAPAPPAGDPYGTPPIW